jgi:hypothetical protein
MEEGTREVTRGEFVSRRKGIVFKPKSSDLTPMKGGKKYLSAEARTRWFAQDNPTYEMTILEQVITPEYAWFRVQILDADDRLVQEVGYKTLAADGEDFVEKACTGAYMRGLQRLGYNTEPDGSVGGNTPSGNGTSPAESNGGTISDAQYNLLVDEINKLGYAPDTQAWVSYLNKQGIASTKSIPTGKFAKILQTVKQTVAKKEAQTEAQED